METKEVIVMRGANARKPEWQLPEPVDFTLRQGEHVAVVGRNGSGKTKFVDTNDHIVIAARDIGVSFGD